MRIFFTSLFVLFHAASALGQTPPGWTVRHDGLATASISPIAGQGVFHSPLLLIRLKPNDFYLDIVMARDFGLESSTVEEIARKDRNPASILINANFFNPELQPLGLIIRNSKQFNAPHRGGSLLGGLLTVSSNGTFGIERFRNVSELSPPPSLAIQAGPRLVVDGRATKLRSDEVMSRRSGIALTRDGAVIIFATRSGLPGISLRQLQTVLLRPELEVSQALNFDGGSSSQLLLASDTSAKDKNSKDNSEPLLVSGGDKVPVFLAVRKK